MRHLWLYCREPVLLGKSRQALGSSKNNNFHLSWLFLCHCGRYYSVHTSNNSYSHSVFRWCQPPVALKPQCSWCYSRSLSSPGVCHVECPLPELTRKPTDNSQKAMECSEYPDVAEASELNPKQQPRPEWCLFRKWALLFGHISPLIPIHRLAHMELLKLVISVMKLQDEKQQWLDKKHCPPTWHRSPGCTQMLRSRYTRLVWDFLPNMKIEFVLGNAH